MQCPVCTTELLHATNFCPVCGASLAGGTPAAQPGHPPELVETQKVVYLQPGQQPGQSGQPGQHPQQQQHPGQHATNVLGERMSVPVPVPTMTPAPAAPEQRGKRELRPAGSFAIFLTFAMLAGAIGWYAADQDAAALAGGCILIAALTFIWYLHLPPPQQHPGVIAGYDRLGDAIDRRVEPLRRQAGVNLTLRRERERYDNMRRERTRRVNDLGEAAYRYYRSGVLHPDLNAHGHKVTGIEQQLLMQDQRMHKLQEQRQEAVQSRKRSRRANDGTGDGSAPESGTGDTR